MPPLSIIARSSPSFSFLICAVILVFCSQSAAIDHGDPHHERSGSGLHPALDLMNGPGFPLLGETDRFFASPPLQEDLKKRQKDEKDEEDQTSTRSPTKTTTTRSNTRSNTRSDTSTTTATSAKTETEEVTPTPPPAPTDEVLTPFDTSLNTGSMQTDSCPTFFDAFLNNKDFLDCVPISNLLKTSSGFFKVTKSFVSITRTLDDACAAPRAECTNLIANLADEIVKDGICGTELEEGNYLATEALNGFVAYPHVRDATCLKNPDTGNYCFADAITNSSSPEDSTLYHLPVGTGFPGGTRPTCNECLQATMAIFAEAAKDEQQPLAELYNPAAVQINMGCGPSFVPTVVSGSRVLLPYSRDQWTRFGFILQYSLPFIVAVLFLP